MIVKKWEGEPLTIKLRQSDQAGAGLLDSLHLYDKKDCRIYLGIENGEQIGIGGVIKMKDGSGEAIMFLSERATEKRHEFHRAVKKQFIKAVRDLKVGAVKACVDLHHPKRMDWIKRLGFEFTGSRFNSHQTEWGIYQWVG